MEFTIIPLVITNIDYTAEANRIRRLNQMMANIEDFIVRPLRIKPPKDYASKARKYKRPVPVSIDQMVTPLIISKAELTAIANRRAQEHAKSKGVPLTLDLETVDESIRYDVPNISVIETLNGLIHYISDRDMGNGKSEVVYTANLLYPKDEMREYNFSQYGLVPLGN